MIELIRKNRLRLNILNLKKQEKHFHRDVELIYILDGEMTIRIYEKDFMVEKEDMLVINSNEPHSFWASAEILYARLYITQDILMLSGAGEGGRFVCNSGIKNAQDYTQLRRAFLNLLRNEMYLRQSNEKTKEINYEYMSAYFHFLELLTVHFWIQNSTESLSKRGKNEQRMGAIQDYVENNYRGTVSFEALAKHMYLSEGYLSRYFRQNFHMKFTDYVRRVRLAHAMEALLYTSCPVTKIAYDNGFSSVSFFNRAFKEEYGKTPSAIRQSGAGALALREQETLACSDGNNADMDVHTADEKSADMNFYTVDVPFDAAVTDRLENYLKRGRAGRDMDGQLLHKRYRFSVQDVRILPQNWNQVINIGAASDLLKSEVQDHIIRLCDTLHFKYVRLWSLFSKDMLIDIEGEPQNYNFTKLDHVFDFLVEQRLIPFIDLEEKIRRINVNTERSLLYEERAIVFKNIGQWQQLLDALMRHLVKRYGVETLSPWKLEVWFGGYTVEHMEAVEGYFHIFRSVYSIVKKYVPELEIGGCGVFPESIKELGLRERNFWEEWRQQAPRPDFISLMNYAYEPDSGGRDHFGRRSNDACYLLHSIQRVRQEPSQAYFSDIRLYITEWNLTVSDRNYVNDSCFMGAYIVKNVIDVCFEVDMLGYFSGSDRTSEYYDSGSLLHGGQGLLTKDSILKPSAFALGFLNHMYSYYVNRGEHFLMTSDQRGNYHMVCHNMRPLSHYYYLTSEDAIEKDKVWCCFEDQDSLRLDFALEAIENGDYVMRIHRVNPHSGSILDVWGEMNYYREILREDIKYFRRICEARMELQAYKVLTNRMDIKLKLEANEIVLVEIHKE